MVEPHYPMTREEIIEYCNEKGSKKDKEWNAFLDDCEDCTGEDLSRYYLPYNNGELEMKFSSKKAI